MAPPPSERRGGATEEAFAMTELKRRGHSLEDGALAWSG
jgi:hypothetical protein